MRFVERRKEREINRMSKEPKALSIQAFGVGELIIDSQVSDIEIFLNFEITLIMGFR